MFLEASEFKFTQFLESRWRVIRDEMDRLPRERFSEWPEKGLYTNQWKTFPLYVFGRRINENCPLCPITEQIVRQVPRMQSAGFSLLTPGTRIKPHRGLSSAVLICHMGLTVPAGDCALRVRGEDRKWKEGKCFVFDDTSVHEAWNETGEARVILFVDFKKSTGYGRFLGDIRYWVYALRFGASLKRFVR